MLGIFIKLDAERDKADNLYRSCTAHAIKTHTQDIQIIFQGTAFGREKRVPLSLLDHLFHQDSLLARR